MKPPPATPTPPAALFVGGSLDHEVAGWLVRDGFAVNTRAGVADGAPLTWEQVQPYHVVVVNGLGMAKADGSLGPALQTTIATLTRFVAAGGGVLVVPHWGQMDRQMPPQVALLAPWGCTPHFDEMVFDHAPTTRATAWKVDFSYTAELSASPLTDKLHGLWLPVATRAGMEDHLVPLTTDANWHLDVASAPTAYSLTVPTSHASPAADMTTGRFATKVPLVASRAVGPGRVVVCGINSAWLWGRYAGTTLEGITRDRGLLRQPSDGYALVRNALRWLAEPAMAGGTLGGAKTAPAVLENPYQTKFSGPADWGKLADAPFPQQAQRQAGVIGARSVLSGGTGTVAEWVAAAQANGLQYLVFLEDFASLPEASFKQLKSECAKLTTPTFAAIPGFRIRDEIGNYYFYASPTLLYPPANLLSADGKVFVANDPGINPTDPRAAKGQLAMTTLTYAYQLGGFKLLAGNYLFRQGAAPVANWYSNYDALGVITRQEGKVIEDATSEYLQLCGAGQGPLPLAVDLLDRPEQLAQTPWRTVVRLAGGEELIGGKSEDANPVAMYFSAWHFYPDNPTRIYVTDGPEIDYWSFLGPRDYEGSNRGDFVWQNLRWRVGAKVRSAAGLQEVAVYDGSRLFRRFLPGGATEFSFALDLTHDRQHNLVLLVTDRAGHRAIGHEQWDRNHRLEEFNCADRNNQLSYGLQTRGSDGTGLMLGGNQPLATPNKRLVERQISPAGTFKNDAFLGAPAFDGGAGGEPNVIAPVIWQSTGGTEFAAPVVGDARRLLHTGDVNIGEGVAAYRFTDQVGTHNVWHTLWRTEPATDLAVTQRNTFFQADPDSPLAVFLWQLRIERRATLPDCRQVTVAFVNPHEARLWAVRGSDGTVLSGTNEDTPLSAARNERLPVDIGGYVAALDSPLGGCAVFPLTAGLQAQWATPKTERLNLVLPATAAPAKAGETCTVELLLVGIPRPTRYTTMFSARSTQTVERFRQQFGLGSGPAGYTVAATAGKVLSQHYLLRVDGAAEQAFSGVLSGDLLSSLPVVVSGLNDHWSAYLYDRGRQAARPLGMLDNQAWATLPLHGKLDGFIGHPVTCDQPQVVLQVTQTGDHAWVVEAHNPTDAPLTTTLRLHPAFDPWAGKTLAQPQLTLPPGTSVTLAL